MVGQADLTRIAIVQRAIGIVTLLGFVGLAVTRGGALVLARKISGPIGLPDNLNRVADLVYTIPSGQRRKFASQLHERRDAPVWPTLHQIIAEEFAVSSETIHHSTPLSYSDFRSEANHE